MSVIMRRYNSPRRQVLTIAFVLLTLFCVVGLRTLYLSDVRFQYELPFGLGQVGSERPNLNSAPTCPSDIDHLRRNNYGLTREFVYQKKCIRPRFDSTVDRSAVAKISEPLITKGKSVRLDKGCQQWEEPKCDTVELVVPSPYPQRDHSDLLLGIATTFDRLVDSMSQFEAWLANTGARLLVIVIDADKHEAELNKLAVVFREHGMELLPMRPWNTEIGDNEQHFTILRDLLWHATPKTKWVGIIDDDTIFPSLYPLAKMLDKHNASQPAYIGGLSENKNAVNFHGYMAFGGAGVFLSMPLLRELEPHIEKCLEEEHVPQGDGLLRYCVYTKTNMRLTPVSALHQMDMEGDMSGFYESGTLPLSLHHWKTWHQAPVDRMSQVSDVCGDCFLQRWQFSNDTVLSNGYSIVVYPSSNGDDENEVGLDNIDLNKMEGTWNKPAGFEWSMGPMRERVPKEHKKSYRLVQSERVGKNLRQVFVHRPEDDLPDMETEELGYSGPAMRDEVVEFWWEL